MKIEQAPLSREKETCSSMLILGDLSSRVVDQLATLVDNVFAPLLSKAENHKDLPDVAIQDISRHVHSLRGTLYQVSNFFLFLFLVQICFYIFRRNAGERSGERQNGAPNASWNREGDGSGEAGPSRGSPSR